MTAPKPATDAQKSKRRKYSSPQMTARRERIVACAHAILGKGGTQALTIERLAREAKVAPRTLYRLFGDKEGVVLATVTDRLREVREFLAGTPREYTLDVVFEELDWMVTEMRRDAEYGRTVIGFFFSLEPNIAAIRELRSVSYNRFRNWLDHEIAAEHTISGLDLDRIAQEHVGNEFVIYQRWAAGQANDVQSRTELRCCFLKSAILVLAEPTRKDHVLLLADHQRALGATELGGAASTNRAAREAGEDFIGRA